MNTEHWESNSNTYASSTGKGYIGPFTKTIWSFSKKANCFLKNAKIVLTHNLSIKFIAKDNTTFLDKQKDISFFMTKH